MLALLVLILMLASGLEAAKPVLPLVFEENRGQAAGPALYIARSGRLGLHLDERGVTLAGPAEDPVRIWFEGAAAKPVGDDPSGGESNYFKGTDPAKWRTHIPHWRRVRYPNLYPGIDLVFYGNGADLEFDFAVTPGADPSLIRMRVDGPAAVSRSGDLVCGGFRLGRPVAYQPRGAGRRAVRAKFRLSGAGGLSFELGRYDRSLPLVIDPILLYTSYVGGIATDAIAGVAADSTGNIYLTGYTNSTGFSTTLGAYKRTLAAGDSDAFITKLNPAGTSILYSTFLGGSAGDFGRAIAVDSSGAAYITGSTLGFFPVTSGAFKSTPVNAPDIFAAKLDSTGATLSYATYLGGAGAGQGIAVDSSGNAWIAGFTYTPSFPTTFTLQPIYSGGSDGFLMKLNATGTGMLFSTFLGGRGDDQAEAVVVDSAGDAYVVGTTSGQGFLVTGGVYQNTFAGGTDAFVTKIRSNGLISYSSYLGGTAADRAFAVAVDTSGNVYVGGQTASTNFPTSIGAFQTTHNGGTWDAFVTKLNTTAAAITYSTLLGGSSTCQVQDPIKTHFCDAVEALAVDSAGSVYAAGIAAAGFPTIAAPQGTEAGTGDGFVTQLNATGTRLMYSTFVGGTGGDFFNSAALAAGVAVVGGVTASTNVPVTTGALRTTNPGGYDGMLTRLGPCTITLGRNSSFFPPAAGNYTLTINAPTGCAWYGATTDSWITVNNAAGIGNGLVTYSLTANTGLARSGQIAVGTEIFTLNQLKGTCVELGYYSSWFPSTGGTYSLQVFATCGWTATSNRSWVTIDNPTGSGNGTISYTLAANTTGAVRTAQIDVNGMKLDVNQISGSAGGLSCAYEISRTQDAYDATGGSSSLVVTASSGCEWNVVNPYSWITITFGMAGNGDGIVGYTVERNATGQPRSAQVSIAGQILNIAQSN